MSDEFRYGDKVREKDEDQEMYVDDVIGTQIWCWWTRGTRTVCVPFDASKLELIERRSPLKTDD